MSDQTFIEMVAYEQMQAQRDRAVAALREIEALPVLKGGHNVTRRIARAALDELEAES